ncbi:hypothetical protein [Falsiroseomonas sp. HW251]|uniref:hypothetical protein n=1 Tax=Falsiroseomonas sp. HW251 TaxID=3390998 RepID=UPI003D312AD7
MAGLDALFRGAVGAVLATPIALFLFWQLTRPMVGTPRWLRPFLVCWASYGAVAAVCAIYAYGFERMSLVDDAMAGALIMGALILLPAFLLLLLVPPRKA